MANDLKLLPQAERLLSGTISATMDETQTTVDVSNPPSASALPTYWEIEPDSSTYKELVRVVGVSSSTVTLERGLNNGGTGFPHASLSPYKGKITSLHNKKIVDALESGYLTEDTSYTFTRLSTSSFKITASGVDRTGHYTAGRRIRINGTVVVRISSSSYSNPDTTVNVDNTTVPTPITLIELEIATKGNTDAVDTTSVQTITGVKTLQNAILSTPTITSPILTTPQLNDTSSDHQYITAVSELTADRTVTMPLLTADDTFVFRNHDNVAVKFNYPRGYLVNGKIVPSVASNNLTVAIKGMDGNDPSSSNPVFVRIGDNIRSITSALSVTKNAGTNWFDSGSAGLATKEIDYFVYLGYNATDGVVIGFSKIPYANVYSQFSTTSTNETYCAISTITNAVAGDPYEVVGRFAATLSAGAGYTWSVPSFTFVNLIQRPIFQTRLLFYVPVLTSVGGGTVPVFSSIEGNYSRDNLRVKVNVGLNNDGGTDGAGANDLLCSVPVGISSNMGTSTPLGTMSWSGFGTTSGTGICQRYATGVLQLRSNPFVTIQCATFPNGARALILGADYDAV